MQNTARTGKMMGRPRWEKKSATMMINSANKPKIVRGYHHLHHHHHHSFKLHCWRPKLILQHYISLCNKLPNEEWEGKKMTQIRSYWDESLSFLSLSLSPSDNHTLDSSCQSLWQSIGFNKLNWLQMEAASCFLYYASNIRVASFFWAIYRSAINVSTNKTVV